MDTQEQLISRATYSVGILATAQLNSFELVELTHAQDAARMEDSRRRGMCQLVGTLAYLHGGFIQFALDVHISESARKSLECVFLERLRDAVAAWQERRKGSADWLERLAQLPDTRV